MRRLYTKAISSIESLLHKLSNKNRHPFLKEDELPKFEEYSKELITTLKEQQSILLKKLTDDETLSFIDSFFTGKTGETYSLEDLEKIKEEGEERYNKKIPPGYMDNKKSSESDPFRAYGDLIVWRQLIDYAKTKTSPVIFITDDKKEDWWLEQSGKVISPRRELIEEFYKKTEQDFWMYRVDTFIREVAKKSESPLSEEVLEEIIKVSEEANIYRDKREVRNNEEPKIVVTQEAIESSSDLNQGLLIITLNQPMRYATGTGKFSPNLAEVPDFTVELISSPFDDLTNIGLSFGCGTPVDFNIHLRCKSGYLEAGEYVCRYHAVTPEALSK